MGIIFPVGYVNGNYSVGITSNGTKTRTTTDVSGRFIGRFPETVDVNISNRCPHGCSFCYISATVDGEHGDLSILDSLRIPKYIELAINYAEHPDLMDFLVQARDEKSWIVNVTINEKSLRNEDTKEKIEGYLNDGLIHGLGISVNQHINTNGCDYDYSYGLGLVSNNIVYHVIAGLTPIRLVSELVQKDKKILILGYKPIGRADKNIPDVSIWINNLPVWLDSIRGGSGGVISFDNLALDQLGVKSMVSEEMWAKHYMGEEGKHSMYIDTVGNGFGPTYSTSSTSREDEQFQVPKGSSIKDLFKNINGEK